ncbi:hypothetical protein J7E18_16405 [Oceanobacillus sp. ISL-73]|uniref:hypothetical protein n=1 Tax=Oceanobacillus sp. ISL-74 TaxID=2819162 RepID=UPI001BE8B08F|nr:hypothetical protein [Oceanobacillus sp. ISL-74]MBT2600916.1 hypothetical protein [Oceanobacillus sp. ISL-74]MBT2653423.1 hypothetical protein [Oceanobacillus sp. ISL-73]
MSKVLNLNSFNRTYKKIVEKADNDLIKLNVEFYHHDFQSEPILHMEAKIQNVLFDKSRDDGSVITIMTNESYLSFTEKNYYTNLSGDDVVFSSKHNAETYCIIQFI